MKTKEKHSHLFGPSGCINQSAFFSYLKHELPASEMHSVEEHLSACLFCNDAMEGYEKQTDQSRVENELTGIRSEFAQKLQNTTTFKKKDNKRFLVIATSIAAVFTVFISAYFLFQIIPTNDKKSEMAINSPSTEEQKTGIDVPIESQQEKVQEEAATKSAYKTIPDKKSLTGEETNQDKAIKYFDKRGGLFETDGDKITGNTSAAKGAEFTTVINAATTSIDGQTGKNDRNITEDAENSGMIDDVTLAFDQKDIVSKETDNDESKIKVESVSEISQEVVAEKIVSGKRTYNSQKKNKENQSLPATGGITRSVITTPLNEAIDNYNRGYIEKAKPEFEKYLETEKNNFTAIYYLAMCHYNKGESDSALIMLEKLVTKKNNSFYESALWQKAQILEELNNKKQAAATYREIIKNNGPLKNNAQKKVDELEKP